MPDDPTQPFGGNPSLSDDYGAGKGESIFDKPTSHRAPFEGKLPPLPQEDSTEATRGKFAEANDFYQLLAEMRQVLRDQAADFIGGDIEETPQSGVMLMELRGSMKTVRSLMASVEVRIKELEYLHREGK